MLPYAKGHAAEFIADVLSRFYKVQMSGRIEHFAQRLDDNHTLRLMSQNGYLPRVVAEPVVLVYEDHGEDTYVRRFPNLLDFAVWYETAEYLLPENGDGPEANGWTVCDA